jgi:DnaJ family protein C protein 7
MRAVARASQGRWHCSTPRSRASPATKGRCGVERTSSVWLLLDSSTRAPLRSLSPTAPTHHLHCALLCCAPNHTVFCPSCLTQWLEKRHSCPTCQTALDPPTDVADLRAAVPLAWRLLGRLRVKCPLHAPPVSCAWSGEYSELSGHLMASDAHRSQQSGERQPQPPLAPMDALAKAHAEAEAMKEAGNEKLHGRQFQEAVKLFSKAISLAPCAVYYANRAAAWLAVGAPREAAADCRAALGLDPLYVKAHVRVAKALCELGQAEEAVQHLTVDAVKALSLTPGAPPPRELSDALQSAAELAALLRTGQQASDAGDWTTAAAAYEEASRRSGAASIALRHAAAELRRGNADRVQRLTLQVLRADSSNADAYALRGAAYLQTGDFTQAMAHLKEALRLAPDASDAAALFRRLKKVQASTEAGRQAAFNRDFTAAVEQLTEALSAGDMLPPTAPLCTALLTERAAAHLRLKNFEPCLADCEAALSAVDDSRQNKTAYITRASCLRQMGRFDDAVASLRPALEMDPGDTVLQKHAQQCDFEARKAKRPDYYALLGIYASAGERDVKVAYKQKAMEFHPDRLPPDASPEKRAEAEASFKLIGEALDILSDPLKKSLYDEGYDKQAIEERAAAAARAAREQSRHGHSAGGSCSKGGGCSGCG